jgi:chemotaxis protein CheX
MLDRSCAVVQPAPAGAAPSTVQNISARIALSGPLAAECAVEFLAPSAAQLTAALLGCDHAPWDDAMVADAVGEICNMIAGGWKKRLGQPAWGADLSVPAISRGPSPSPDRGLRTGATTITRAYAFDGSPFVVHLTLLQPVP